MRGICAIAVMVMHSSFLSGYRPFPSAYVVVDLFFMMSGFVIGLAYDRRLIAGRYFRPFLARRLARLLPMWAIGMAIGGALPLYLALRHGGAPATVLTIALNLLFLPWPLAVYLFPFNPPGWSLFFEMAANLFYAAIARLVSIRILAIIVAVSAIVLLVGGLRLGTLDCGGEWATFPLGLARVCFGFFLGVLAFRLPRPTATLHGGWFGAAMLLFVALTALPRSQAYGGALDVALILAACPGLLWLGIATQLRHPRWAESLGALSYPLYATHFGVMGLLATLHVVVYEPDDRHFGPGATIAIAVAMLALAYALGEYVDPAAQRLAGRWLRQRAVAVPTTESPAA